MLDIHTTRERLSISSTKRVWEYLLELLRVRRNVVLIGMPGAGKSTVGVVLAKNLGYRFVDSDLVIQERSGKLLHELISEKGIDGFQAYEDEVNASLYEDQCVIATGGSAIFGECAMRHLGRIGTIVYLKLPYEDIEERLGDLTQRGVTVRPGQTLKDLYEERRPLYEKYAQVTIDCTGKSIREIVTEISRLCV
jgi:shikimate kinase